MIDLRTHFEQTLKAYGHKAIYRRYRTGEKSPYYSELTREGVGGERWAHDDTVILCRHSPTTVRGSKGAYEGRMIYYLLPDTNPKVNDVIIEVNGSVSPSTDDQTILNASHRQVFRIEDIDPKQGADGEIIYYTVYARPDYGYY